MYRSIRWSIKQGLNGSKKKSSNGLYRSKIPMPLLMSQAIAPFCYTITQRQMGVPRNHEILQFAGDERPATSPESRVITPFR